MGDGAKTREVIDGVVQVFLPLPMRPTIVNVYLVRCGDGWTLVDTGMHTGDSLNALRGALAEVGIAPRDIRRIVCTHHHMDHYGSSEPLRELMHAEVHLHPLEAERAASAHDAIGENAEYLRRNGIPEVPPERQMPPMSRIVGTLYRPAIPDQLLADGDELPLGDGRRLDVVWTPGHTPGHCCLLLQPDGVLFVGDHLLPKITPHVGIISDDAGDPLGDFLASLRKVGELDVETVLPAHGAVYYDHRKRVTQLIEFHDYRMQVMLDVIRGRPATAYDVALEAFDLTPHSPFQQQFPATFETLAHLEHMRLEGRTEKVVLDDRVVWRAKPAR